MSIYFKKGLAVWILGFLTILSFLNVLNSAMMWMQNGQDYLFEPYLLGQFIGNMQVTNYFWISVTIGFVFLGCTAFISFRNDYEIINAIEAQKRTHVDFLEAYRTILKSHENLENHFDNVTLKTQENIETHLDNAGVELSRALGKQETIVKNLENYFNDVTLKTREYFDNVTLKTQENIETHLDNAGVELSRALGKQETIVKNIERLSKNIKKVENNLSSIRKGLQSLEDALLFPNPKITAESSPMEIDGIGPTTAKELAAQGITNAGEFLLADPTMIADFTRLSREQTEYLQGMVQLLMIPGIDKNEIELFKTVGVTNRKELAVQDPFEFNIKLGKAYTANEKYLKYKRPTLPEVLSWVRTAKI